MEVNGKNGSARRNLEKEGYEKSFGSGKLDELNYNKSDINGKAINHHFEDIDELKKDANFKYTERRIGLILFAVTLIIVLGKIFLSMRKLMPF